MKFPERAKSEKKAKAPKAPKKISRTKNTKYVLFVGDEGAILVYMQGIKVLERVFAAGAEPENTREFSKLVARDPKAPIYLLVDMMDQSFVRHTLPPVTSLSVNKLIQRRLDRDFAPEDIKGAISLGREKDGRKDWNYLLISLANSPQLNQWINLALELPNSFKGIFLVPVEAQQFVRNLSNEVNAELGKTSTGWQLLVSHNRVGGFRQVVLKDGKLIFTRMAQPIGESLPEVIAGNIEQEVQNTVEYLKRLSLQDQNSLEIYIIASKEIKDAIDVRKFNVSSAHVFTPFEAAERLGLPEAVNPSDHYGDVLLSVNFGSLKKNQLKLNTPYARKIDSVQGMRIGTKLVASLGCVGMLGYAGYILFSMQPVLDSISDANKRLESSNSSLGKLREETSALPADIDRITDVVSVYEKYSVDDVRPLSFVTDFAALTGDGVQVETFKWNREEVTGTDGKTSSKLTVNLNMEFIKNTDDIERFVKFANNFFGKMKTTLSAYDVSYAKLPGTVAENETLEVSFDDKNLATQGGAGEFVEGKPVLVQVTIGWPKQPVATDPNAQPGGPSSMAPRQ